LLNQSPALLAFGVADLDPLAHQQAIEFLATSTDAVLVVDAAWRLIYLSPNSERSLGKSQADLVGKHLWEEFPEARDTKFFTEYQRAMQERVSVMVEEYFAPANCWYEGHASPFQGGLLIYFRNITERKQTIEALRESEDRYRDLIENSGLLIGTHDVTGRLLSVNRSVVEYSGLRHADNLIGKSVAEFLAPNVREMFDSYLQEVLSNGYARGVVKVVTGSGEERILEYNNSLRAHGIAPIVRCIGRDVTEQKRAEAALARSEERFRSLSASSPVGIFHTDAAGLCLYTNARCQEIFGLSFEQCLGTGWSQALHPDDREPILSGWLEAAREGRECDLEFRVQRPDGEIRFVHARKKAMYAETGELLGFVGTEEDVTERKRAEERLLEQTALLNHAQEAIIACDPAGRIVFWNPGAERIYGWKAEEVTGRNLRAEVHGTERLAEVEAARQVLHQKGEWVGEWRQFTKDKREIIVESHCTLVRDEQGHHKATLIINNDITEKKRLEAQYLRAQRLESIGALASGIAHDLNNLLAPMMMVEHILQLKLPDPHSQRLLETLRSSIQRASGLVKQVVSFARGTESEQTTICPKYLLKDIEHLLTETFPRSIEIYLRNDLDLWPIQGDATQIFQVLMNLCVNARDAMPNGGLLTLSAEKVEIAANDLLAHPEAKCGPYVCFTVTDTGIGIAPHIRERIFDPFFTTKEQGRGTGLGLATALRIVTAHSGFIAVASEVGQGAQFKVYLPAAPEAHDELSELDSLTLPVGEGELILVVEDEAAIREVTRETLETYGYRVLTANEGAEAVALYAQHLNEVQAVLLDMVVPMMDGRAIIRALRKLNPQCRIIATSGLLLNEIADEEVAQFLSKPFTAEKLLKTLATVIRPTG
jgi:PAS domain S-box-containing protein